MIDDHAAYRRSDFARSSLRRGLFRRRHLHRRLLPADLPGENTAAEKLPLFRERRSRGEGIVPSVPALPAGTGAGPCAGRSTRIASLISSRVASTKDWSTRAPGWKKSRREFEISSRQLRRIVQKELGVSPIELMQTRRLLLAKQLLTETKLPVTEIAFASGFSSLRRFNDAFGTQYRMPPTRLRKQRGRAPRNGRRRPAPRRCN